MLALLLPLTALAAPYGVPVDGYPSAAERILLLWTNAARVDPEGFDDEYKAGYEPCGFADFLAEEQVPKAPMYLDVGLTEAARSHSTDMRDNGCFQHESCDGTDTWTRIARYYTETSFLGENIAMGTTDPRYAVMGMWMCSDGHRANIMTGGFEEMGPGIAGNYLTQNFAGGGVLPDGLPPVRVAVLDQGTFYADWGDEAAPKRMWFVVEGVEREGRLAWGTEEQGIWSADGGGLEEGCQRWHAEWGTSEGRFGRFPEDGSFQAGSGCDADWTDSYVPAGGLFGDAGEEDLEEKMIEDLSVGCTSAGGMPIGSWMGSVAAAALLRRRRKSSPLSGLDSSGTGRGRSPLPVTPLPAPRSDGGIR
jgi:uncharacterized protein (TIGR03382 family)